MTTLPRRSLLVGAARFATAAVLAPALVPLARAAESCVDPASESLRSSLNYAAVAADPAKACGGCAFFKAEAAGTACGACEIMSGPVERSGTCDSWSPPD